MIVSRLGVLQGLTTFFIALQLTPVENSKSGDVSCQAFITKPCELRWSKVQRAFVTSLHEDPTSDFSAEQLNAAEKNTSLNRNLLCLQASEGHRIVVKFTMGTLKSRRKCDSSLDCEFSCIAIQETRARNATRNQLKYENFSSNFLDVRVVFFNQSDLFRVLSRLNSSTVGGQVERFARQTIVESRRDVSKHRRVNFARKHRNRKKCKIYPKGPNRRKPNHKHLLRNIAAELLREIHKTSERVPGANTTASIAKALRRHREFRAARQRINRLIKMDRRRRTSSPKLHAQFNASRWALRAPSSRNSFAQDNLRLFGENGNDNERSKRAVPDFSGGPQFMSWHRGHILCDPEANYDVSSLNSNSSKTKNIPRIERRRGEKLENSSTASTTIDWVGLNFPLLLRSDGRELRLSFENDLSSEDPLIRHLVVQVTFEPVMESSKRSKSKSLHGSPNTVTIEKKRLRDSLPTETGINTTVRSYHTSGHDLSVLPNEHDHLTPTIGVVAGVACFVGLVTGMCLFLFYRARRRNLSKTRRSNFADEAEAERCLAEAETSDERPSYGMLENGNRDEGFRKVAVADSDLSMLEHKKRSKRVHGRSSKRQEVTAAMHRQDRRTHQASKCTHAQTARGTSRHEHCIVCQIADKPHQPIVTGQYTSDFLPPASRHLPGFNANLANSHDNFDKFNRMQNNPYRNSPRLPPKTASLPRTVKMPDGEERRGRQEHKLTIAAADDKSRPVCIKPPPNRTVFGSDDLPFSAVSDNNRKPRPGGYPGPPSSACKGNTALRDCNFNPASEGQHDSVSEAHHDGCICRYILNGVDEPPPKYSDVVVRRLQSSATDLSSGECAVEVGNS